MSSIIKKIDTQSIWCEKRIELTSARSGYGLVALSNADKDTEESDVNSCE